MAFILPFSETGKTFVEKLDTFDGFILIKLQCLRVKCGNGLIFVLIIVYSWVLWQHPVAVKLIFHIWPWFYYTRWPLSTFNGFLKSNPYWHIPLVNIELLEGWCDIQLYLWSFWNFSFYGVFYQFFQLSCARWMLFLLIIISLYRRLLVSLQARGILLLANLRQHYLRFHLV